jgi:hypothetical protein
LQKAVRKKQIDISARKEMLAGDYITPAVGLL